MTTPHEVNVRRFEAEGRDVAVFEFQGELRDLMVSSLRTGQLTTGHYVADAKAVSPQGVLSMVTVASAASATALSATLSGTLFMATANPASLMTIGSGVGSAVMGASGIVAQAPFIPVAASLPFVAPILAVSAINTVTMLQQFHNVDRKLDAIKSTLDTAIARAEATHVGELLTASHILDEVYQQYELGGEFSNDMLVRLALAERDVRRLAERFRFLVDSHSAGDFDDFADVQRANFDAHSAMLASVLDLRISYLRVCVDLQENPKAVGAASARLKAKIEAVTAFWEQSLQRSEALREAIQEREAQLADMNWAKRNLPEFIGGQGAATERKIEVMRAGYVATMENERAIMQGFHSLVLSARQTLVALEGQGASGESSPTLVYWQDELGEHSFSTESLRVV